MFCTNCGSPFKGSEKFCTNCGAPRKFVPAPETPPAPAQTPVSQPAPKTQAAPAPKEKSSAGLVIAIVVIAAVLAIAAAAAAWWFLLSGNVGDSGLSRRPSVSDDERKDRKDRDKDTDTPIETAPATAAPTEEPVPADEDDAVVPGPDQKIAAMAAVLPAKSYKEIRYTGTDRSILSVNQAGDEGYVFEVDCSGRSFSGTLSIMVGVNTDGTVAGVEVLESSETSGLGAMAKEDASWRAQFAGKSGTVSVDKDGGDITAISGATITSRGVCAGVNAALAAAAEQFSIGNLDPFSDPDSYILPSDTRYLTLADLEPYDAEQLKYIRNEIYARHGYTFTMDKFRDYFLTKNWYYEDPAVNANTFGTAQMNEYELANLDLIRAREAELG